MADKSKIEWTDATWNPIRGCNRVSEGCRHCYAEGIAARFSGAGEAYVGLASIVTRPDGTKEARWTGELRLVEDHLLDPLRWKRPRRVFVNSMSDLFHEDVPLAFIKDVFAVMAETPRHTYQILTKRADRLLELSPELWWPENVWMGVSVENDDYLGRADRLRRTAARVKFLSLEPLLGPLVPGLCLDGIHWVIVGGESGPGARPIDAAWVRAIRDVCVDQGVAFHFKQWGGPVKSRTGRDNRKDWFAGHSAR